jgi:hypothetical protein
VTPNLSNPLYQALFLNKRDNRHDELPVNTLREIANLPLRIQLTLAANFTELAVRRHMCIIHNQTLFSNGNGSFTRGAGMNGLMSAVSKVNGTAYPPPVETVGHGYNELPDIISQAKEYTQSVIGNIDRVSSRRLSCFSLDQMSMHLRNAVLLYERDSPYDEFSDRMAKKLHVPLRIGSDHMLACLYTELAIRRRLCMAYNRGRTTSMILNTPTFHNEVLLREASGEPADIRRNEALPVPGMTGLRDALEQATEDYVASATQHPWHELKDLICLAKKYTTSPENEPQEVGITPRFGWYIGDLLD